MTGASTTRKHKRSRSHTPHARRIGARACSRNTADTQRIRVIQDNPKRPGSQSHVRFDTYKAAGTYADYRRLGGTASDYTHDLRKGYVQVVA